MWWFYIHVHCEIIAKLRLATKNIHIVKFLCVYLCGMLRSTLLVIYSVNYSHHAVYSIPRTYSSYN